MLYVLGKLHVNSCDLMSVTESSTESEGPLASRTRSRYVAFSAQSREWCDCARTTRKINFFNRRSFSTDGSLSLSNSYLETEFPAFPARPPVMENRGAHPLPHAGSFGSTA